MRFLIILYINYINRFLYILLVYTNDFIFIARFVLRIAVRGWYIYASIVTINIDIIKKENKIKKKGKGGGRVKKPLLFLFYLENLYGFQKFVKLL